MIDLLPQTVWSCLLLALNKAILTVRVFQFSQHCTAQLLGLRHGSYPVGIVGSLGGKGERPLMVDGIVQAIVLSLPVRRTVGRTNP